MEPLLEPLCCSVQFSSVAQSCPTLRDPMNRSTPGLPVHHQLPDISHAKKKKKMCVYIGDDRLEEKGMTEEMAG